MPKETLKELNELSEETSFKINIKTIISIIIGISLVVGFYYEISSQIEEAKVLPKIGTGIYMVDPADPQASLTYPPNRNEFKMKDELARATIANLETKIEELEEDVEELKKIVYSKHR